MIKITDFPEPRNKKYLELYIKIINIYIAQDRKNIKGNKHHIIPKAYNGSNESYNIINLTYKEHYILHHILYKAFGGKMTQAFWLMCHYKTFKHLSSTKISAKQYAELKKEEWSLPNPFLGKHHTEETKRKLSEINTGKKMSEEWCIRNRLNRMGEKNGMYGKPSAMRGKHHTEETKRKIREGKLGEKNGMYGRKLTLEEREVYRQAQLKRKSRWMTNGIIAKTITEKEQQEYLNKGWVFGRIKNNPNHKVYINNGKKQKYVLERLLSKYDPMIWKIGKLSTE